MAHTPVPTDVDVDVSYRQDIIAFQEAGDAELGTTGAAGLASVETLDESGDKTARGNDDGMETVRLDADATDNQDPPPKRHAIFACISAARNNLFVTGECHRNLSATQLVWFIEEGRAKWAPTAKNRKPDRRL